jgi:Flp pilus assembly pilin Flp
MPSRIRSGQSIIEYTVIAGVVMMAIVLGGPFLVNSVQAHFRGLDDSVQESALEDLKSAAIEQVRPGCVCHPWKDSNCGGQCPTSQREKTRACVPMNCIPMDGKSELDCVPDPGCCGNGKKIGCGRVLNVPGSKDEAVCQTRVSLDQYKDLTVTLKNNTSVKPLGECTGGGESVRGCAYNEVTFEFECGDTKITVCAKDEDECSLECGVDGGVTPTTDGGSLCDPAPPAMDVLANEVVQRENKTMPWTVTVWNNDWAVSYKDSMGYRLPYVMVANGTCPQKADKRACIVECGKQEYYDQSGTLQYQYGKLYETHRGCPIPGVPTPENGCGGLGLLEQPTTYVTVKGNDDIHLVKNGCGLSYNDNDCDPGFKQKNFPELFSCSKVDLSSGDYEGIQYSNAGVDTPQVDGQVYFPKGSCPMGCGTKENSSLGHPVVLLDDGSWNCIQWNKVWKKANEPCVITLGTNDGVGVDNKARTYGKVSFNNFSTGCEASCVPSSSSEHDFIYADEKELLRSVYDDSKKHPWNPCPDGSAPLISDSTRSCPCPLDNGSVEQKGCPNNYCRTACDPVAKDNGENSADDS